MTFIAAFDAGATRTRAGLYDGERTLLAEAEGLAANPIEGSLTETVSVLESLLSQLRKERVDVIVAGISGAGRVELREDIARTLAQRTGCPRVIVANDLYPVLHANAPKGDAVLAIAGTGSSVLATRRDGQSVIVGGRGCVFGDDGSAYQIAVSAMRAAAEAVDGIGPSTALVEELTKAAGLESFDELVPWSAEADKREVAALGVAVESAAVVRNDAVARACINHQAMAMARQCQAAARKLGLPAGADLFMHGALFEDSEVYRSAFLEALALMSDLIPAGMRFRGHRAVLEVAFLEGALPAWASEGAWAANDGGISATERVATCEKPLDALSALEIVRRMNREDSGISKVVSRQMETISRVVDAAASAIGAGGRIIYVGAGTSGRLGVLDASECPPTFGVDASRVIGLIAGGEKAIRASVEGAEDDAAQGARDLHAMTPPVDRRDLVVGIAASGSTPYVRGALEQAKGSGAITALVACVATPAIAADYVVAVETGPEVIAGSTRLKAGTATKMVLNVISTGAMTLSGMVYDGLMVGVRPINAKLRARAIRIVRCLTFVDDVEAERLLEQASGRIPVAVLMSRGNLDAAGAEGLLESSGRSLRGALEKL